MPVPRNSNAPGTRDLIASALNTAWQRAIERIPQLALIGVDGGNTKAKMAAVIEEAASHGITDLELLIAQALDVLPKLRNR